MLEIVVPAASTCRSPSLLAPISSLISLAADALREHGHLAGDDREATALSTGPHRFHCGIVLILRASALSCRLSCARLRRHPPAAG
jgi:hypothetical protein